MVTKRWWAGIVLFIVLIGQQECVTHVLKGCQEFATYVLIGQQECIAKSPHWLVGICNVCPHWLAGECDACPH